MAGILNVVATPIGNLEDITLRALRVLKEVDVIAAEDTRHTRKLLTHYGIKTKLVSYHDKNERGRTPELIARLGGGEDVALVTDAGTPGISDPGYRLITAAAAEGIDVVSVPGPSAIAAAISISALPIDTFSFKGFVPTQKGKRKKFFESLRGADETFVMYESPKRLAATLKDVTEILGAEVKTVVLREMTKMNEEVLRGTAAEVLCEIEGRVLKGEITLVLSVVTIAASDETVDRELKALLDSGLSTSEASRRAAVAFGLPKGGLYKRALKIRREEGSREERGE